MTDLHIRNAKDPTHTHFPLASYYLDTFLNKSAKNTQWGKDNLLKIVCGGGGYPHAKELKANLYLIPYTKIIANCIKELNVRYKIVKLIAKKKKPKEKVF